MKKTRDRKGIFKYIFFYTLGLAMGVSGVLATNTLFASNEVVYDNSSSGATSSTVQGALDELYELAKDTTEPTITFDPAPTDTCNTEDYSVNISSEDNIGVGYLLYCKAEGRNKTCVPNIPGDVAGTDISIDTDGKYTICVQTSDTSGNIIKECSNENGKYYNLDKEAPTLTVDGHIENYSIDLQPEEEYTIPTAVVTDSVDDNVEVAVEGTVNTEVAGTYEVTYTATDCAGHTTSLVLTATVAPYKNGTPVYFNPETGEMCTDYTESQSTGTANTGCLKWYIIDSDTNNVDMLLDHNIANLILWNSAEDNTNGPSTKFLDTLNSSTANWIGVSDRTDTYIDPAQGYTIDYTGYKARLIEANEVWGITKSTNGQTNWDSRTSSSILYFEGNQLSGQGTSKYPWLYDYTRDCTSYGCNVANSSASNGYWTSSAMYGISFSVWSVYYTGYLNDYHVRYGFGLRPVITIDKTLIDNVTPSINYNTTGNVYNEVTLSYNGYSKDATYQYCLSTMGSECTPTTVGIGTSMKIGLPATGNYKVCANVTEKDKIEYKCSDEYNVGYEVGTFTYFNPETGERCSDYTETQSTGTSNTGCLKWYIIDSDTNNVDMILDHNTGYNVYWNSSEDNTNGPSKETGYVLDTLNSTTANWTGVQTRTDKYIDPAKGYTIDYAGYKARLIEANEVWEITKSTNGKANWDSGTTSSNLYFEGSRLSGQGTSKYPWLYDYTSNCTSYGCNIANSSASNGSYGYWTSSADYGSSMYVWRVFYFGYLDTHSVINYAVGVRPVITISKSQL